MTIVVKTAKAAAGMKQETKQGTEHALPVGAQITLSVHRLGYGGMGIGKDDSGVVVLVPKTIPGELVKVEIVQSRRRHLVGRLLEVVTPSPLRVAAVCDYYDECGGCHLQQLSYPEQLKAKHQVLTENLNRKEPTGVEPDPVAPGSPNLNYRNKNFYHCQERRLGFINPLTHELLPIASCPCAPNLSNLALQALQQWLTECDDLIAENLLDVLIRQSIATDQLMVILVFADDLRVRLVSPLTELPDMQRLALIAKEWALFANFKPRSAHYSFGETFIHLGGATSISEKIGRFALKLSPSSFVQIHPPQATALYTVAMAELKLPPQSRVLDLYSGSGALSMFLSEKAGSVYSIELNRQAVLDAEQSLVDNGVSNVTFRTGKCERIVDKLLKQGEKFSFVALNPPRTGCDPTLWPLLKKMGVERMIYVSCSPPTLKRDLLLMGAHGFRPTKFIPFDMFPQTYHLEVLTVVERSV